MSATDWLEGQIGTHLLRTSSWTKPTDVYVALFTTIPDDDGTNGVEVTGTGYARIKHGPADDKWAAPVSGNGVFSNIGVIQFGSPTANWGTVTSIGLFSAVTGGTLYAKGALGTNVTVNSGDPAPAFAEGTLTVTLS
jgi:hypothetical protein